MILFKMKRKQNYKFDKQIVFVTQTTLSVDDTKDTIKILNVFQIYEPLKVFAARLQIDKWL